VSDDPRVPDGSHQPTALPVAPRPRGRYEPAVVHGDVAYSAGMTPRLGDELIRRGTVGAEITVEQARELAGRAAANALSAIGAAAGGIDNVARCLRLTVYVAAAPGFAAHSTVADGASEALGLLLGDRGSAARSAIGVASLPSGAPVEVELIAALVGASR
jgi:enamine deaminase RidA (YjgF/YER057c/UK114 family)